MADPVTAAKSLILPTVGGDTGVWGGYLNVNSQLIDNAIGGTVTLALSGNTILTSTQTEYTGYKFGGTIGGTTTITWPAFSGLAVIQHNVSGGFSLVCGVSGAGAQVTILSGTTVPVWSDGVNFTQLVLLPGGAPETGTGPLVLQNTPEIITPVVSGSLTIQGTVSGASVFVAPASGGGTLTLPIGTKTLADTLLDNVTLTGDVNNTGLATEVVNLSHVANASLVNSALASGYLTIGTTQISLGSTALGISGINGLQFAPNTPVGASGFSIYGLTNLTTSGVPSITIGTSASIYVGPASQLTLDSGSTITTSGLTLNLSGTPTTVNVGSGSAINTNATTFTLSNGSIIVGTGGLVISGVTSLSISGAGTLNMGSGSTITGSGLIVSGVQTVNGVPPLGILFQSTLPFVMVPSSTMLASGAITFGTALPAVYPNAYGYFASGVIASGQAAGWYFFQATSQISAKVYNNTYSGGQPSIPGSLNGFASGVTGAFAGSNSSQPAYSLTIPAGAINQRSTLRLVSSFSTPGTSGTKSVSGLYGGVAFLTYTQANSGIQNMYAEMDLATNESPNTQYAIWNVVAGTPTGLLGGVGSSRGAVNASGQQQLSINLQMSLPADYLVLEHATIEILKGP